jgi:hypothetical protein
MLGYSHSFFISLRAFAEAPSHIDDLSVQAALDLQQLSGHAAAPPSSVTCVAELSLVALYGGDTSKNAVQMDHII